MGILPYKILKSLQPDQHQLCNVQAVANSGFEFQKKMANIIQNFFKIALLILESWHTRQ